MRTSQNTKAITSDKKVATLKPKFDIEGHFDTVMNILCFGMNHLLIESKKPSKMTRAKIPFVQHVLYLSVAHPQLIPGYLAVSGNTRDKGLEADLKMMAEEAKEVFEMIAEKNISVTQKSFEYAIAYFRGVKEAAAGGMPVAKKVYDELVKKFGSSKYLI